MRQRGQVHLSQRQWGQVSKLAGLSLTFFEVKYLIPPYPIVGMRQMYLSPLSQSKAVGSISTSDPSGPMSGRRYTSSGS